eukprot:scaffold795_cov115-Isochrysis_galbana.AAC.3
MIVEVLEGLSPLEVILWLISRCTPCNRCRQHCCTSRRSCTLTDASPSDRTKSIDHARSRGSRRCAHAL